jgi:hypothetical protein
MAAWPHGDPDAVVRAILATAPYRRAAPETETAPGPDLLGLAWKWLVDHVIKPIWDAIFGHLPRTSGGLNAAAHVVEYAVIGAAAIMLAYAAYRLVIALAKATPSERRSPGGGVALATVSTSEEWRRRAAAAARAGDYGRAIAALFRASLAVLDERAVVVFDATRTPGEYRRLVRRERALAAEPFNDLAGRFVRAAYAEAVTTADDYAGAERAYAAFEPATGN